MKLYICSSGSYSDYGIEAIFMDKEKAEEYTRLLKCDNDIEEWETEDENWINGKHDCKYFLKIDYNYDKQFDNDNIKISKDFCSNYRYEFSEDEKYPYTSKYITCYYRDINIRLNYPCNKDVEINEELKNKYLKICRDYLAQAKQLLADGHDEYNLGKLMFGE